MKNPFKRQHKPRFPSEWMVVGLGNPGREYSGNRHNVGFWVVNRLAKMARANLKRTGTMMTIASGEFAGTQVAFVKPLTYVNQSGKALNQAVQWTGCDPEHIIVVYDELDMDQGGLRIRAGGGYAGHNGLKSIGGAIGPEFIRIRIGIGRPTVDGEPSWEPDVVGAHVLGDPDEKDRKVLDDTVSLAIEAIDSIINEGTDLAASRYNRRRPPSAEPKPKPPRPAEPESAPEAD